MNTRTTLVLYGTRNGCTRKCAVMVQERIGSADVLDIMRVRHVDLGGYDTVVLGSSVWMGKVHGKVRRFAERHVSELLGKRVGLFICSGDERTDHFRANYPAQLVDHAEARAHFGGELDIDAFGPLMRFLLARKAGVTESYNRIKPEVISSFAAAMRTWGESGMRA